MRSKLVWQVDVVRHKAQCLLRETDLGKNHGATKIVKVVPIYMLLNVNNIMPCATGRLEMSSRS